jgi:hypothetical protein
LPRSTSIRIADSRGAKLPKTGASGVGPAGGNERAAAVLARLGVERREVLARLHGTVVITGRGPWGADTCVPPEVLTAVERCGLETSWPRG